MLFFSGFELLDSMIYTHLSHNLVDHVIRVHLLKNDETKFTFELLLFLLSQGNSYHISKFVNSFIIIWLLLYYLEGI